MKTRTKLFLIPVLAVAVVAFAFLGIVNLNAPAKVSAEDKPVYVYFLANGDFSGTPKIYYWGEQNIAWGDAPEMELYSGNVYRYNVAGCTGIIFRSGWNQTVDVTTFDANDLYCITGEKENGNYKVAKVNAPAIQLRYYNENNWGGVWAYSYMTVSNNTIEPLGGWPGTPLQSEDKWFTVKANVGETIIFNNGDNGAKTGDLPVGAARNYYKGTWYTDEALEELLNEENAIENAKAAMKEANTWYLIGKLNGAEANWIYSTAEYKCDEEPTEGNNKAIWYGVELKAGDLVKAVHGNDVYSNFEGQWKNGIASLGINTVDEEQNAVILYDGTYNVYLFEDGADGIWKISVARVQKEDLELKETKHKTSSDGKYLLLVTGFKCPANGEGYSLGYFVDGVKYEFDTYYEGVWVNTTNGKGKLMTAEEIYGEDYSLENGYYLIVLELEWPEEEGTWTKHDVRAFVAYNGEIVDMGDVVVRN